MRESITPFKIALLAHIQHVDRFCDIVTVIGLLQFYTYVDKYASHHRENYFAYKFQFSCARSSFRETKYSSRSLTRQRYCTVLDSPYFTRIFYVNRQYVPKTPRFITRFIVINFHSLVNIPR